MDPILNPVLLAASSPLTTANLIGIGLATYFGSHFLLAYLNAVIGYPPNRYWDTPKGLLAYWAGPRFMITIITMVCAILLSSPV